VLGTIPSLELQGYTTFIIDTGTLRFSLLVHQEPNLKRFMKTMALELW